MEFVYRQIEYLIEGSAAQQRKLNNQQVSFEKIWKKLLKHVIFYAISFVTTATFLAYIIGIENVLDFLKDGPVNNTAGYAGLYGPENSLYDLVGPVLNAGYLSLKISF